MRSVQEILQEIDVATRISNTVIAIGDSDMRIVGEVTIHVLKNLKQFILSEPEKKECDHAWAQPIFPNDPTFREHCDICGVLK